MNKENIVIYMYDKRNKTTDKVRLKNIIDALNIYNRYETVVYSLTKKIDLSKVAFGIKYNNKQKEKNDRPN
jgi:hypothetical protein